MSELDALDFVYEECDVVIDEANDRLDKAETLATKKDYPGLDEYLRTLSVGELSDMIAVIVIASVTEEA